MRGIVRQQSGYTLIEITIALFLMGLLLASVMMTILVLQQRMMPQRISLESEALHLAPTFAPFPSAVALHQALQTRVQQARAVYVFGGTHTSIAPAEPPTAQRPLLAQALPSIETFSAGLPLDAKGFYDAYTAQLGSENTAAHADDFTVVTVGEDGGVLKITSLIQCIRKDITISDGSVNYSYIKREVKMWEVGSNVYRYAFAEYPNRVSTIKIGAVHTWLRYKAGKVAEEGPAVVTFPDPWVYAGERGAADDIPPFSRFNYFFAVTR